MINLILFDMRKNRTISYKNFSIYYRKAQNKQILDRHVLQKKYQLNPTSARLQITFGRLIADRSDGQCPASQKLL